HSIVFCRRPECLYRSRRHKGGVRVILYYAPGACTLALRITIEEIGLTVEFKRVDLKRAEQSDPAILALNLPVLVANGRPITEIPAILMFLGSQQGGEAVLPRPETCEYARCMEQMAWLANALPIDSMQHAASFGQHGLVIAAAHFFDLETK